MKIRSTIMFTACFAVTTAVMGDCIWVGGSSGNWADATNWIDGGNVARVPTTNDVAIFNSSVTVAVNTGTVMPIRAVRANENAGLVMLTTGTAGTVLDFHPVDSVNINNGNAGLCARAGSTIDLGVPANWGVRVIRSGAGTVIFRSAITMATDARSYIGGTSNVMERGASFTGGPLGIGWPGDNGVTETCLIMLENASIAVEQTINPGTGWDNALGLGFASASVMPCRMVMDGDEASITCTGSFHFAYKGNFMSFHQKRGTVEVTGLLGNYYGGPGEYVIDGGTSSVRRLHLVTGGDVYVNGGRMSVTDRENSYSHYAGGIVHATGGTLVVPSAEFLQHWLEISGNPKIQTSGTHFWDPSDCIIIDGTILGRTRGSLTFDKSCALPCGFAFDDTSVSVNRNVTLTQPDVRDGAVPFAISNGVTVSLANMTTRLSLPLDLSVSGTGAFAMNTYVYDRGLIVAHRYRVNGVEQPKGRYAAGAPGLSGPAGASIVVPYVWTGNGDGTSWNSGANWAGGAVPPSGADTCVDVSRASSITLDGDVVLTCLVSMPNHGATVTISGVGSLTFSAATAYTCGMYVKEGTTLVIDKDVARGTANTMSILGGGVAEFRKGYPGVLSVTETNGVNSYVVAFSADATIRFAGNNAIYATSGFNGSLLSFWSHGRYGKCRVEVVDGAKVTATRLVPSVPVPGNDQMYAYEDIRFKGGRMTVGDFRQCVYSGHDDRSCYISVEGGEFAAGSMIVGQKAEDADPDVAQYGYSRFEMTAGTFTLTGGMEFFRKTRDSVKLCGGVFNVGGNIKNSSGWNEASLLYLGGVRFHPTADMTLNVAPILVRQGGYTVFDLSAASVSFNRYLRLRGSGTIIHEGNNNLNLSTKLDFSGRIVANAQYTYISEVTADDVAGIVNGLDEVVVTNSSAIMVFNIKAGGVSPPIGLVSAPAENCLRVKTDRNVPVKRLIVGGVEYAPGTLSFKNGNGGAGGTITVEARPASWLVDGAGDLSFVQS